ncbi:hypothetical protein ACWGCW_35515 [Streptomyces sp. NPDC054933]
MCTAPSLQASSFGPYAFWNASTLIQEVTVSRPAIINSGARGDQFDGTEGVEGCDAIDAGPGQRLG